MSRSRTLFQCSLVISAFLLGCGGGDGPTTPPPPPGDGTVVLLDGARWRDWSIGLGAGCRWTGGAFIARDSTWDCYYDPVYGDHRCWGIQSPLLEIASAPRLDLRPYSAARLQCRVRGGIAGSTGQWSLDATVVSNVPGTGDLRIIHDSGISDTLRTYDLSLANALSYSEATLQLRFRASCGRSYCNQYTPCGYWYEAQLLDLRVVGTRRQTP